MISSIYIAKESETQSQLLGMLRPPNDRSNSCRHNLQESLCLIWCARSQWSDVSCAQTPAEVKACFSLLLLSAAVLFGNPFLSGSDVAPARHRYLVEIWSGRSFTFQGTGLAKSKSLRSSHLHSEPPSSNVANCILRSRRVLCVYQLSMFAWRCEQSFRAPDGHYDKILEGKFISPLLLVLHGDEFSTHALVQREWCPMLPLAWVTITLDSSHCIDDEAGRPDYETCLPERSSDGLIVCLAKCLQSVGESKVLQGSFLGFGSPCETSQEGHIEFPDGLCTHPCLSSNLQIFRLWATCKLNLRLRVTSSS